MLTAIISTLLFSSGLRQVDMGQLQSAVNRPNDTLYVVNFWATWCKPCVNEMPYFENAQQEFGKEKVKVIFVSLNSTKEVKQVEKLVSAKALKAETVLLDAGNPNNWINTVDSSWSGAIPATAMYRRGKKVFFREGEFEQPELYSIIKNKMQSL